MDRVDVDGLSIAYERAGVGPPVVLLHGILQDSRVWRDQLDDLSDEFTVVAWDAPGCGRSPDPPDSWRLPDYGDCLVGFVEATGLRAAHLLGLSWSSGLVLQAYRSRPAVARSLVLTGGYAGWAGSLPPDLVRQRLERAEREADLPPETWVPGWLPGLLTPSAPAALVEDVAATMSEFHPAGYRVMARAFAEADLRAVLPRVRVPTLLLHGELDQRSPLSVAEDLHARIPSSELVVLPGVGHLSHLEAPQAYNAAVRRFVRAVGSDGATERPEVE